jgi:hypothetical protein
MILISGAALDVPPPVARVIAPSAVRGAPTRDARPQGAPSMSDITFLAPRYHPNGDGGVIRFGIIPGVPQASSLAWIRVCALVDAETTVTSVHPRLIDRPGRFVGPLQTVEGTLQRHYVDSGSWGRGSCPDDLLACDPVLIGTTRGTSGAFWDLVPWLAGAHATLRGLALAVTGRPPCLDVDVTLGLIGRHRSTLYARYVCPGLPL